MEKGSLNNLDEGILNNAAKTFYEPSSWLSPKKPITGVIVPREEPSTWNIQLVTLILS